MTGQLTDQFIQKASLDALGADPRALGAVQWTNVATKENLDGSQVTTGYHEPTGESRVISQVPAPEGFKAKEPKIKQVDENGTIYDVETRDDGSEWLLGKQGSQRGAGIMIKPPNAPEGEGLPAGKGETETPESQSSTSTGDELGVAEMQAQTFGKWMDSLIDWYQNAPGAVGEAARIDAEVSRIAKEKGITGPKLLADPEIMKLMEAHPIAGFGVTEIRGGPRGIRGVKPTPESGDNITKGMSEVIDNAWQEYKGGKPKGVDFNVNNLDTTESAVAQFNTISKAYAAETLDRTQGVIPLAVTRQVADLLGTDAAAAEKAIGKLPVDTQDLHVRALVMRDALVTSAENLDVMARRISSTEVLDSELLSFREALAKHAILQANMKGVQTEIGRALSAFRIPAGTSPLMKAEITRELLDQLGGPKAARAIAERWANTPVADKGKIAARSAFATGKDAMFEIWINGLLSSFRTQEANFISTQAMIWLQIPERAVAGVIGAARQILPNANQDRVYVAEAMAMIKGYVSGAPKAAQLAWDTFKTGVPSSALSKVEAQSYEAITAQKFGLNEDSLAGRFVDYVGLGVRMPGRMLMTADEFNRGVGQQMQREAIAYRQTQAALDNGAKAEDAAALYRDIMQGKNAKANEAIAEFGDTVTFTKALGEAGQSFQKAANTIPGARLVVPFIRTPVNVLKEVGKRTPLAWVGNEVRADLAAGGARRDLALARISLGSAAMAWGVSLAMEDRITGGGPKEPKLKAAWDQKYQAYSVNVGTKENPSWISYKNIEPLATLLGVAANYTQVASWLPRDQESDLTTLAVAGTGAVLRDIADKGMLTAIGGFAKALDGEPGAIERFFANYARSAVPASAMMNDIEKAIDPTVRNVHADPTEKNILVHEFERMLNEVEAHTPGLSESLPPQVYAFGEEKRPYTGDWYQAFNALAPRDTKPDAIINELTRLRMGLEPYSKDIDGAKLTPWQQYHQNQIANNFRAPEFDNMSMREYMNWLVQSGGYLGQISDKKKADILTEKHTKFLDVAERIMLTPGSKDFDADLYSNWIVAKTLKPLGMKP